MPKNLFDLTGRKALVTGASGGIGKGYAHALASAGADVAILCRNADAGAKVAAELTETFGVDSFFQACDVSQESSVDEAVAAVVERFGRLDIGVNNAGIGILGGDADYSLDDWNKVIGVNLTGMWLCARAEGRVFIKQGTGGKIVNTASMSARISNCNVAYNASKAAVVQMTKMLAAEWGAYNINVNSISPSYLLSPMHASTPLEIRQKIRELTPLGYVQRPEDLYGPIIFLASDASNYVTGHDLLVDGGHTLNVWMAPLQRAVPPRVSPAEESAQLKKDLAMLGVSCDDDGINVDLHPEIADSYRAMLDS